MHLRYFAFVFLAAMSGPTLAQTPAPTTTSPSDGRAVEAPKPQMIKKTVCRRVDVEQDTGSRIGSAPRVCKVIEVPAPAAGSTKPERGLR